MGLKIKVGKLKNHADLDMIFPLFVMISSKVLENKELLKLGIRVCAKENKVEY